MDVSGQLHAPALSLPGNILAAHWLGSCVDPRADLDAVAKKKPVRNLTPIA